MLTLLNCTPSLNIALENLGKRLQQKKLICATAESCTAGLLGASITSIAGASTWYAGGIIAYANEVKIKQLNVPEQILIDHGAVSAPCVMHMASGICEKLGADIGISVSGIAGPGGGTDKKPVGTVWIGFSILGVTSAKLFNFQGDRESVRMQAVVHAIEDILKRLG